jgi:CheY-like chemotaxis protein
MCAGSSLKLYVLVVEDSAAFSKLICNEVRKRGFVPQAARSYAEAKSTILERPGLFFAALLDLSLPDAPDGEIVDLVTGYQIPSIVLTGMFDPEVRHLMEDKPIVDFVLKQGIEDIRYALETLERIRKNRRISVLVVDDSRTARAMLRLCLESQLFCVVEAEDGKAALARIRENPAIKMAITDYNMPGMDGFELTRTLRKHHTKEELAVIAVSSSSKPEISSRFLKYGANDFLAKPYTKEELISRVHLNLGMIEAIAAQKAAAKEVRSLHAALVDEQHEARSKQIEMVVNDYAGDGDFLVQVLYKPSDILSGDLYSLHKTHEGGALIYLIDGMGHGLIPSFTAFGVASAVKQAVAEEESFTQLLERVSQTLRGTLGEEEQLSYSFFYLPPDFKQLEYAIGGMYPAQVMDSDRPLKLQANNPPFMSFMPTIAPAVQPLTHFNKLLTYTDGLVEDSQLALSQEDLSMLLEGDTFVWIADRLEEAEAEDDTTVLYFERLERL